MGIKKNIKYKLREIRTRSNIKHIPNINTRERYIFIHVPKNGGTSIYKALGMSRSFHLYYSDYEQLVGVNSISEYFRFSFVRNPWARFVSLYDYARKPVSYHHNALIPNSARYGKHEDYDILKEVSIDRCAEYLIEGLLTHGHPKTQWDNQCKWLLNKGSEIRLSFLGRMENFNSDIRMIETMLNKNLSVRHLNSSSAGHYRDRLSQRTRKILAKYYEQDIDLFKYTY